VGVETAGTRWWNASTAPQSLAVSTHDRRGWRRPTPRPETTARAAHGRAAAGRRPHRARARCTASAAARTLQHTTIGRCVSPSLTTECGQQPLSQVSPVEDQAWHAQLTGAGGDNGTGKICKRRGISGSSYDDDDESHDLPPHPQSRQHGWVASTDRHAAPQCWGAPRA
jgi:hypothetical protein